MRRALISALLVLSGACGKPSNPAPDVNVRGDYYAMMYQGARLSKPGLTLQILSESVTTVLDSAELQGIDKTYAGWQMLASGGNVTSVTRTVLGSEAFGDTVIRDHGRIVFSRTGMKDTTMVFVSRWRSEKAGWKLYHDSVRANQ